MKFKNFITVHLFLLIFANKLSAQTAIPPSVEIQQYATIIYTKSGLAKEKIPFDFFLERYKEFLNLKLKGIAKKNIIGFIDYNRISGSDRFIIIDATLSSPRLIASELVAHGQNSGSYWKATKFSNASKSFQSSLGTMITGARYHSSRFGDAMRLKGITSGYNTNVSSRAIVLHSGFYVNKLLAFVLRMSGKSKGCLTVRKKVVKKIIDLTQNGSVFFAYHKTFKSMKKYIARPEHVALARGGRASSIGSVVDDNYVDVDDSLHFSNFPDSNLSTQMPFKKMSNVSGFLKYASYLGVGVIGASQIPKIFKNKKEVPKKFEQKNNVVKHIGDTKFTGSPDYESCQMLSSEPLDVAARKVQKNGENPHKFFRGSWKNLSSLLKSPISVDNGFVPRLSRNHLDRINKCSAILGYLDINNFQRNHPNGKVVKKSRDRKISCRFEGSESTDTEECENLISTYENLHDAQKKLVSNQGRSFKESSNLKAEQLKKDINIQATTSKVAESLNKDKIAIASERERFKGKMLNNLSKSLSAFPSYRSLYSKCRTSLDKHDNLAIKDYVKFNEITSNGFDYSLLALGGVKDPCEESLKNNDLVLMQNNHVKDEVESILDSIGIEKSELNEKIAILNNQKNPHLNKNAGGHLGKSSFLSNRGDQESLFVEQSKGVHVSHFGEDKSLPDSNHENLKFNNREDFNTFSRKSNKTGDSSEGQGFPASNNSSNGMTSLNDAGKSSGVKTPTVDSLLEARDFKKLSRAVKEGKISWNDIVYEYQKGKISKENMKYLASTTGNKIFKLNDINKEGSTTLQHDIHKENVSLFKAISTRYIKSFNRFDTTSSESK